MTVCPVCGEKSDRIYRCDECGKDLVDVDDSNRERPLRADGGTVHHAADCRTCDWRSIYEGTISRTPREQAEQATGGHLHYHPDHEIDVYPVPRAEAVDELYYASGRPGGQRHLHVRKDCRTLADVERVTRCPASHPPRGQLCGRCAAHLSLAELTGRGERPDRSEHGPTGAVREEVGSNG